MSDHFAFVFPGQGSQSVGMCADAYAQFPIVRTTFEQANDALGYDLWALISNGPADRLNQTDVTQPALLAADVALWRAWCEQQAGRPAVMAGHSLGEFAALVAAEALRFEDAIRLVAARGRFMQQAVPDGVGAMAAIIGLTDEQVRLVCESVADGEVVAPANYNSVGQVVIAGHAGAVDRAINIAKEQGARLAKRIPVSVPSHCALMQPAADNLSVSLQEITVSLPKIPVIHNVDVATQLSPEAIKQALVAQLTQPVRWVETIQKIAADDITTFYECGPGNVLVGLIKRISKSLNPSPIQLGV